MRLPPCRLMLAPCLAICLGAAAASAQDRLVFKDSPAHVQDGKIVGMNGSSVLINIPAGQMAYDLGLISRVDAAPPPAYQAGSAAYTAGQWDKALAGLKPVVDQFRGLPTDWARQATGMLGDVYIEKNDVPRAEAAYNDFRRLYPGAAGGTLRAGLGQARIAFARNNTAVARQQLDPIMQAALKNPAAVSQADGAIYGQAFYLSGQLREKEGSYQGALEDYLRTVTLFYQDSGVAGRAQKSADALRAAHKDVSVP